MIYGLTLTKTAKLVSVERMMDQFAEAGFPLTLRIIADPYMDGFDWKQLKEPIRRLSKKGQIMLCPVDSYYVLRTPSQEFRDRVYIAMMEFHDQLWAIEYANEYGGSWLWNRFKGRDSDHKKECQDKLLDALHQIIELDPKFRTVVTYYLDAAEPEETLLMAKCYPLPADIALVSYYPRYYPHIKPDLKAFFSTLLRMSPKFRTQIGWGEFGIEPQTMNAARKEQFVRDFMALDVKSPNYEFIGGGFYWQSFRDLVANPLVGVRTEMMKGFAKWGK